MKARTQAEHEAINAREYPGTRELCCECDAPTGRAGVGEDSLYRDDGEGLYCADCWKETTNQVFDANAGPVASNNAGSE